MTCDCHPQDPHDCGAGMTADTEPGPEGTNGTRLVRMSEEMFTLLAQPRKGFKAVVDWGTPTGTVVVSKLRGMPYGELEYPEHEPVYAPTVRITEDRPAPVPGQTDLDDFIGGNLEIGEDD